MIDIQPAVARFVAKLIVVMIAPAWVAVNVLPGVQQFVQQYSEGHPKWTPAYVATIQGNFTLKAKSIVSGAEMPVSVARQLINPQCHLLDIEFKLRDKPSRPNLELLNQISGKPGFSPLMEG
jgi:hypothetical protein